MGAASSDAPRRHPSDPPQMHILPIPACSKPQPRLLLDNDVGHRPSSSPGKCIGSVHLTFVRLLLYSIVGIWGSDLGLPRQRRWSPSLFLPRQVRRVGAPHLRPPPPLQHRWDFGVRSQPLKVNPRCGSRIPTAGERSTVAQRPVAW